MPTNPNLSAGSFTIGPNNSIAIFDANGEVDWGLLTQLDWASKQKNEKKEVNLMDGNTFELVFLKGYTGDFSIQRTGPEADLYFSGVEAAVAAGSPYPTFTIIQTINETDGSITRFTFLGATITYDDAGTFSNDEGVVLKFSFSGPRRTVTNTSS